METKNRRIRRVESWAILAEQLIALIE